MPHRLASLLALLLLAPLFAGCGGNKPITADSGTQPSSELAPIKVEILQTYFNNEPFGRFTARFTNPSDQSRAGVQTTWTMLDKDDVIVGTYDHNLPTIGGGQSIYYVGGAGGANLTGTPARAKIEVTDKGTLTEEPQTNIVLVSKAKFSPTDFDLNKGAKSYDVSAVLAVSENISTEKIDTAVLLKDAKGKVVGSDWADLDTAPEKLDIGAKVKVTTLVAVPSGTPKSIEFYAYSR